MTQDIARLCERLRNPDWLRLDANEAADALERLQAERDEARMRANIRSCQKGDAEEELTASQDRVAKLEEALTRSTLDNIQYAYDAGIERDGMWWHGCMSDAEWLTRELELSPGWHDAKAIKKRFFTLASRLVRNALEQKS